MRNDENPVQRGAGEIPKDPNDLTQPAEGFGGEGATFGHGRDGIQIGALALLLVALAAPAFAQAPPAPLNVTVSQPWTATIYTGASTVATTGEKREFLTARITAAGPLGGGLTLFARADLEGTQDGGSLSNPRSFRAVEINGGVSRRLGVFDVAAIGGVTTSIEGATGAPVDPRLWTGAALARVPLKEGGYAGAGFGWYGPVGGYAALFTASVSLGHGAYSVADYALPIQTPAGLRPWLLKIGATVRVKSIDLGALVGR